MQTNEKTPGAAVPQQHPGETRVSHQQQTPSGTTLQRAEAYRAAELSVIPIAPDGTKAPAVAWKPFQTEIADEQAVAAWFAQPHGIGIVCGAVSGNLEVIDFDDADAPQPWAFIVESELPGLLDRLPHVRTPTGGLHVYYRCDQVQGNAKLARRTGDGKALIETRGEGGYVLAPGGVPEAHALCQPYVHVAGPAIEETPTITPEERAILWRAAKALNQKADDHHVVDAPSSSYNGAPRPGDAFNRDAAWDEILSPHGWTCESTTAEKRLWRRPGKEDRGWSATTGYCSSDRTGDLLYVFSSNAAPFEPDRAYSKFAAWTMLNHGGDFKAAARALRGEDPAPGVVTVGGVELVQQAARETDGGTLKVTVQLVEDGGPIDEIVVSSTTTGRARAVKAIADRANLDRDEVDAAVGRMLVDARRQLERDRNAPRDGKTVADLVTELVPPKFDLKRRTERGAFSRKRDQEVTLREFGSFVPAWLMESCADATDAARDKRGSIVRATLRRQIKGELETLWATLLEGLPSEKSFRAKIIELLAKHAFYKLVEVSDSEPRVPKAFSLAQEIAERSMCEPNVAGWQQAKDGVSCWWRWWPTPKKKDDAGPAPKLWIGLRYDVVFQARGVTVQGVTDQRTLRDRCRSAGILAPLSCGVPMNLTGGDRLVVLDQTISAEVLDRPALI